MSLTRSSWIGVWRIGGRAAVIVIVASPIVMRSPGAIGPPAKACPLTEIASTP